MGHEAALVNGPWAFQYRCASLSILDIVSVTK
jgi:hypothetical protein